MKVNLRPLFSENLSYYAAGHKKNYVQNLAVIIIKPQYQL